MKNTLLTTIALAIAISAFAQKESTHPAFGEITAQEISMQSYPLDTTANAVILFDVGQCMLTDGLVLTFKRHIRIKFFGPGNIDEYANVELEHNKEGESINKIKASTYNMENGKLVETKLTDNGIFKGKIDKYTGSVKFTLPNVKPGSIIEYSYTLFNDFAAHLPQWQFQHTIPTIYSEYEAISPKAFTFRKDMQGFLMLTDHSSKNEGSIEKYIMKDAPAFKVEPFLTTPEDYLSAITFYITAAMVPGKYYDFNKTWRGVGNDHEKSGNFGALLKLSGWLDKTVEPLVADAKTQEEKARKIHDYVKSNIAWNDMVDRIPDHTLRKVMDEKSGSSSEINMLLIAMLRRAGLEVYPVLVSTRKHGIVRHSSPNEYQFNDVVALVKIDGKDKFLDATEKTLAYGALPERDMNGEGLLIKEDASDFVPIVSSKSKISYNADFKLSPDGEMSGKLTISRDGLSGGYMRSSYASLGKEKYLSESFSDKGWEFSKSDFENVDSYSNVPKESHEVVIRDHAQANGDIIYVNPYLAGTEENNFKSEKREYPVHMPTPIDHLYTAKIEIPAGYKVEELPANKMFVLPENGGKFIYSTTVIGNTINFTSQLSITKNLILPTNYPLLREFYSVVVAKQAEQIVLKKAQ